ncbi:hypothetical protein ABKN59_009008 [Abortiporus biennis]
MVLLPCGLGLASGSRSNSFLSGHNLSCTWPIHIRCPHSFAESQLFPRLQYLILSGIVMAVTRSAKINSSIQNFTKKRRSNQARNTSVAVIKPFRCRRDDCTQACLKRHDDHVHKGKRNFPCDQMGCDKWFKQSAHLDEHKRQVHEFGDEVKCDIPGCLETFRTRHSRSLHKKNDHTVEERGQKTAKQRGGRKPRVVMVPQSIRYQDEISETDSSEDDDSPTPSLAYDSTESDSQLLSPPTTPTEELTLDSAIEVTQSSEIDSEMMEVAHIMIAFKEGHF